MEIVFTFTKGMAMVRVLLVVWASLAAASIAAAQEAPRIAPGAILQSPVPAQEATDQEISNLKASLRQLQQRLDQLSPQATQPAEKPSSSAPSATAEPEPKGFMSSIWKNGLQVESS